MDTPSALKRESTTKDLTVRPRRARRALGWLLIVLSPVFLHPVVLFVLGSRPVNFNAGALIVLLCFPVFTAAFLCTGIGLVRGRRKILVTGVLLFTGALVTYLTMFVLYITSM